MVCMEVIKMALKDMKTLDKRTPEERKMIASMGGKKQGENRRKRKALKEYLELALQIENEEGLDYYTLITKSLLEQAENGNVKAYEVIRDTLGQSPKQQVELSSQKTIEINITGDSNEDKTES